MSRQRNPSRESEAARSLTDRIVRQHEGRDPERLVLKDALLRRDAFSFLRGTAFLFWSDWPGGTLDDAPAAWSCGDAHSENFGTFRGFNRLVYFDMNDFDEACLAPATWDIARLLTGLRVAARIGAHSRADEDAWASSCLDAYARALAWGRAMWVERAVASGAVRTLVRRAAKRKPRKLFAHRAVLGKSPKLVTDGVRALPAARHEKLRLWDHLDGWLRERAAHIGEDAPRVVDVARRIAGNGSLGTERYVALAQHLAGESTVLVDIKRAPASAAVPKCPIPQPVWRSEADRVVWVQRVMQAASPAFLGVMTIGAAAYVVRELQPSEDRLAFEAAARRPDDLASLLPQLGAVLAWNQLRASGRAGAAVADDLMAWAQTPSWQRQLLRATGRFATQTIAQWQSYCAGPGLSTLFVRTH
ncbi:MAG: DUF2252 domain-containing protein [Betaproteobacteria bacterium]|nr:DUF2252 domain-containing protein [Betaproteobacteria bacterium]